MNSADTSARQFVPALLNRWAQVVGSRHAGSAAAMIGYLLSVAAANIASAHCPSLVIGALIVPAGTVFAGTSLTARDIVYDRLGARGTGLGIAVAAGLSALLATPQIAVASVVAFSASEIADSLIYSRLRHRSRLGAVAASNTGGLLVDSALFVPLAFSSFAAVPGQIVVKAMATLLTLLVLQFASVVTRREAGCL